MESKNHFLGKIRIEKLLLENNWEIYLRDGEDSFPFLTSLGERQYWPDLLTWKDGEGWVCFEVDGKKGHWTRADFRKMQMRDLTFLQNDIRTVRISTVDLVGRKKQDDSLLLSEIDYQLTSSPSTVSTATNPI